MIPCPKCNESLEVSAERILVQALSFDYKKRGKGIRKKNTSVKKNGINNVEVRVFFSCVKCFYATDNLSSSHLTISKNYPELLPYKEEIEFIIDQ